MMRQQSTASAQSAPGMAFGWVWVLGVALTGVCSSVAAQDRPVYRCPGNLYTDQYSQKEAAEHGCKTLEGAPVTVLQSTPVRRPIAGGGGEGAPVRTPPAGATSTPVTTPRTTNPDMRVDPAQQRARDSDARRILETELRKEEERLAALQKDYNQGEPERRGDERNASRYQERVAEMKSAIARKEADIAAIKRELGKMSGP